MDENDSRILCIPHVTYHFCCLLGKSVSSCSRPTWNEGNQQFCIEEDKFCYSLDGILYKIGVWHIWIGTIQRLGLLLKQQEQGGGVGWGASRGALVKGHAEYWEKGSEFEGNIEKNENHASAFQTWLLCHYVPCVCKKGMYLYTGFKSEHLVAFKALQTDNWLRFQGLLRLNMKLMLIPTLGCLIGSTLQ